MGIFITECSSKQDLKCGDTITIKNNNGAIVASSKDNIIGFSRPMEKGSLFENKEVNSKIIFINEHNRSIRLISESV